MEMFNKRISQNILMVFIINVLLIALANKANAQNFQNGDLNGVIGETNAQTIFSSICPSWETVQYTEPFCEAISDDQATADVLGITGPSSNTGVFGNPFSGLTFIAGVHQKAFGTGDMSQEGIQQEVYNFIVGETYELNFYQANVKSQVVKDTSGGWAVYMNGNLEYVSASSVSYKHWSDPNLDWEKRAFVFTASSTNILFQFLPKDDDNDLDMNHGVRMGIDSIYIKKLNPCTNPPNLPDSLIYSGNTITIDAGAGYNTYVWNTGETSQTITADVTGHYIVTVTQNTSNGKKCSYTDSVFVSVINNGIEQNDTTICANETLYLSVNQKDCKTPFAHYPFDGNVKDESANGMNDGINSGASSAADRFNNPNGALSFDGVGDFVNLNSLANNPANGGLDGNLVGNISFWFKADPNQPKHKALFEILKPGNDPFNVHLGESPDRTWEPSNTNSQIMGALAQNKSLSFSDDMGGESGPSIKAYSGNNNALYYDDKWHFFSMSVGSNTHNVIIDGNELTFVYPPNVDNSNNPYNVNPGSIGEFMWRNNVSEVSIGGTPFFDGCGSSQCSSWHVGNESHYFKGEMDDVMFFDCPLDNEQAKEIYLNGSLTEPTFAWSTGATTSDIVVSPSQTTTYYVTVSNGISSYIDSMTVTVSDLQANVTTTDISCYGSNDGAAQANAVNGIAPYSYAWSTGDNTAYISGLFPGAYSLTVTDDNSCTDVVAFNIIDAHMLSIILKANNVECFGDSTGSVLSNVSGGTAPYTYSWDNGGSTPNISGLVSGAYSLTVTDDNGCVQSSSIQLNQSPQMVVSEDVNDVLCYGLNSGSIELVVSGGSPTYTYAWDNGSSSSLINNLYSGTYIYTVTDKLGCEHGDTINVLEPSDISITLSSTDVLCNGGSNGEISSTISGGVTPYVFSWNNGYVTPSISALSVGVYSLTVSDSNGCQKSGSVIINEPAELILDLDTVNVLCFGDSSGAIHSNVNGGTPSYSYSWSNGYSSSSINNLIVGSYTLVVTDGNGCSNTAIAEVTEEDEIIIAATIDGVLCENEDIGAIDISVAGGTSPYEYSWSNNALTEDISNLAPGVYDLNVKDLNNCIKNESFVINAPPPFNIDLNPDTFVCEGEKVVLTAQGGVSYQWSNGNAGSSIQITANQTASYTVTVTSINGCVSEATSIVGAWSNPVAEAGEDTTIYVGMSTTLNGSGGLSFSWTPEDYLDCPDCPNPISTPEIDMEYVLWVTDENGCISSDTVWVFINSKTNLYVPNAFSPDNDGFNDEFKVYGNNIEALNLVVYDRWGEIVFQSNSQQIGWDGTFKGEALNNATFVYLLKVRTAEGEDIIQKGDINLLK